jgi:hypothetical protein
MKHNDISQKVIMIYILDVTSTPTISANSTWNPSLCSIYRVTKSLEFLYAHKTPLGIQINESTDANVSVPLLRSIMVVSPGHKFSKVIN